MSRTRAAAPNSKPKEPTIEQHEWDFRGVNEADLQAAIKYEYARSAPWVRQEFEKWRGQKFQLPEPVTRFRKFRDLTIGTLIDKFEAEIELPPEITFALANSKPEWFLDLFGPMAELLYPRPFVNLEYHEIAFLREAFKPSNAFTTVTSLPEPRTAARWARDGIHFLALKIDLAKGKNALVQGFKDHLDKLLKTYPVPERRQTPRGRAAASPWQQLKQLAAYRFQSAGFSHEKAQTELQQHASEGELQESRVLPWYVSSAWYEAVQEAQRRIDTWWPRPTKIPPERSVQPF